MSTLINEKFDGWDKDSDGKRWEEYDTVKCPDGQVIDMNKLFRDQEIAKAALLHIMPWFGEVIAFLKPIYTFRVKTQATDGAHLLMNPQYTYNLTPTEKVFLLAHEIMHCMLNHMRRGKDHEQERSNIAADYEVNLWVDGVGLIKAETIKGLGGLFNEKYRGWGYERIYADNPSGPKQSMNNKQQAQQAQKNQQGQEGKGQDGSGGGQKKKYTADYKAGWNQAMEDYKNGKIKL